MSIASLFGTVSSSVQFRSNAPVPPIPPGTNQVAKPSGGFEQSRFIGLPDGRQVQVGRDEKSTWWVVTPNQDGKSKNFYRLPGGNPSDASIRAKISAGFYSTVYRPGGKVVQNRFTGANQATNPVDNVFQAIKRDSKGHPGIVQKIEKLSPAGRNLLVAKLAQAKHGNETLLEKFLGEFKHNKGSENLNDDMERRFLMRALVRGQTPEHLNKIYKGFKDVEGYFNGRGQTAKENRYAFAEVLANTASESQKIGLIKFALADSIKGDSYAGYLAARLIGSLKSTAEVGKIIENIDRSAASKLVKSAVTITDVGHDPGALGFTYQISRADVYQWLMKAVSLTGNAREKSKFVAASGDVLSDLRNSGADPDKATRKQVLNGMNAVIGSDPSAVIENTLLQEGRPSGIKAMKEYNRALVECGMPDVIGLNLKSLQLGSSYMKWLNKKYPDGIPTKELEKELKNQPDYIFKRFNSLEIRNGQSGPQVATTIGSYMATVNAGIDSITTDRNRQLAIFGLAFTGSADVNKEYMGIWFSAQKFPIGVATAIAKPLVNYILGTAAFNAAKEDKDLKAALNLIAVPRKNGVRVQSEAFNAYGGAFAGVSIGL